jgi:hypothetical protein
MSKFETMLSLSETGASLVAETKQLELEVADYKIDTPEQRENASKLGQKVNALTKKLEDERMAQTRPIDAAKKAIMDLYTPYSSACLKIVETIKSACRSYDMEQQRIANEAAAKARKEAEEAAQKERDRLAKLAEKRMDEGKLDKADEFIKKMGFVTAEPMPVFMPSVPKIVGEKPRKVKKFEVTDKALVPEEYKTVDETKIRKVVNALGLETNIPGVRVWEEDDLSFSRR